MEMRVIGWMRMSKILDGQIVSVHVHIKEDMMARAGVKMGEILESIAASLHFSASIFLSFFFFFSSAVVEPRVVQ